MYRELKSRGHKIPFHMPGSKQGAALDPQDRSDVFSIDVTELPDTDNLHAPTCIIANAQKRAASLWNAAESFFLVGGSTCGILAALSYLGGKGKTLIVDRNCHMSMLHGMILMDIRPVYLYPQQLSHWQIPAQIRPEDVAAALKAHPEAAGVVLTCPNYYGVISDIKSIAQLVHQEGKLLCVDEAHGAHFIFSPKLPDSAISCGADLVIQSVHKTLPAPTQAALMHISHRVDSHWLKKWLRIYQTSSPSYILMGYTDLAIETMARCGEEVYEQLYAWIQELRQSIPFPLLDGSSLGVQTDFSRLVIHLPDTMQTGFEMSKYLDNRWNIAVEMADLTNIVCIAGKGNTREDFVQLARGLRAFSKKTAPLQRALPAFPMESKQAISPSAAFWSKSCFVPLEQAVGSICVSPVVSYPPGVGVILPGEQITQQQISYLLAISQAGGSVIGLTDGKIEVTV